MLNLANVTSVDQSACYFLDDLVKALKRRGICVLVTDLPDHVETMFVELECKNIVGNSHTGENWIAAAKRLELACEENQSVEAGAPT